MKRIFTLAAVVASLTASAAAQGILSEPVEPANNGLLMLPLSDSPTVRSSGEKPWIAQITHEKSDKEIEAEIMALSSESMFDDLDGDESRFERFKRGIDCRGSEPVPEPGAMIAIGSAVTVYLARRRKAAKS